MKNVGVVYACKNQNREGWPKIHRVKHYIILDDKLIDHFGKFIFNFVSYYMSTNLKSLTLIVTKSTHVKKSNYKL